MENAQSAIDQHKKMIENRKRSSARLDGPAELNL